MTSRIYELGQKSLTVVICLFGIFSLNVSLQFSTTVCTSCWILRPKGSEFDSTAFRCGTTFFMPRLSSAHLWNYAFEILHYYRSTTSGRMHLDCFSWIRWLVSRIRTCADKLCGGWKRDEVQRTAKRYDDDSDGQYVGMGLLLLAVVMAARALHPQTSRRRRTRKRDKRRKHSQICVVQGYGAR